MNKSAATVQCSCKHDFQDKEYGPSLRLATLMTKSVKRDSETVDVRCTVCSRVHSTTKGKLR